MQFQLFLLLLNNSTFSSKLLLWNFKGQMRLPLCTEEKNQLMEKEEAGDNGWLKVGFVMGTAFLHQLSN